MIKFNSQVAHRVRSLCYPEVMTLSSKCKVQISNSTCNVRTNTVARLRNHYCSEKVRVITYSECVFLALDIQLVMRMRLVILSSLTCPAV
jgi:hypothetical protein